MTKQAHSLLNRGKGKTYPKAPDEPHWMPDQVEFTDPDVSEPVSSPTPQSPPPTQLPRPKLENSNLNGVVTVVMVNFNTKSLMRQAYRTFRSFYPSIPFIIVDNASSDGSGVWVQEMAKKPNTHITPIVMDHNVGHGPAMNKAIRLVDTPYVLTLDTDTETVKGGWLEQMVASLREDDKVYAIGWKRWVDKLSGVPVEWHTGKQPSDKFIPYIHPSCGLYRVAMYHTLSPFFHHGAPCLNNMREAHRRKLKMVSFPIRDYVLHLAAGTRRMYNGRWDPKTSERRSAWKKQGNWPI